MLITLAGISVILTALLFGRQDSIPVASGSVSGAGADLLGAVYVAAGLVLSGLGVALGRLATWARTAIACLEVFLVILIVFRSLDVSVSTFLNAGLFVAVLVLLFAPSSSAALSQAATPPG
ncbi:MAG: hypothetical protein ACYDC2_13415 [Solirubrobacteraceae bacterium]